LHSDFEVRVMTRPEMPMIIDWAAQEGWNPGLGDADCFFVADPGGFLLGVLKGEPIACISVVEYGDSFGFLGFYMVKAAQRGQGYGLRIWQAGLARLGGRTVGLDGVLAQQDNYRQSGFLLAYRTIRYQGSGGGVLTSDPDIIPLAMRPFDEICAYDQLFFPARRQRFLQCWIAQPQSIALGCVQNGALAGYGVLRPCRQGYKIGPLCADSPALADRLFVALKAHAAPGAPIFLDTPEINPAAIALARQHKMSVVFETARMYKGQAPALSLNRLFGVTSFELG
jgi:hypothetical protein